jgi:uncharacterized damage-inducible protein DinB
MIDPRFPIGEYIPTDFSEEEKNNRINTIQWLPKDIELAVQNFNEDQYNTPYREGGWTVKQLIHHVADSHMNAYIRFKLGLTEVNPIIKPYDQDAWVTLNDKTNSEINISLTLLHALHVRWTHLLQTISTQAFLEKTVVHPEHNKQMTLWYLLGMYAWHSKHHLAHITTLIENKGWK